MDHPLSRTSSSSSLHPDVFHRPYPSVRTSSASPSRSESNSPRASFSRSSPTFTSAPLLPVHPQPVMPTQSSKTAGIAAESGPTVCGMPLKYVSLVTLAVQNAALAIVMHYSRVSTPASESYSPASAVFLNELLKGSISLVIAFFRIASSADAAGLGLAGWLFAVRRTLREIFSNDCWKLSIPAILYVIQNSLQFVAVSNLPVATFQVTYQMKILTTAAFSVALLRKRISASKWISLFFLAIGVAIVQLQTTAPRPVHPSDDEVGSAYEAAPAHVHIMNPMKGFGAVAAACFTSGLAGVYFEMVLKNSKADLWVRNVQLSLFSLIPAAFPIFMDPSNHYRDGIWTNILRNFGGWAWATVMTQVFGGLITAVVIKYSDNILKGFATSLSIVLSFLASVALFGFRITPSFLIGSTTVLVATWMYNQPPGKEFIDITAALSSKRTPSLSFPGSPVDSREPIIGELSRKQPSPFGSPRAVASALGFAGDEKASEPFSETLDTSRYLSAPYGSPFPSRTPSPIPTPPYPPPPSKSPLSRQNSGQW